MGDGVSSLEPIPKDIDEKTKETIETINYNLEGSQTQF